MAILISVDDVVTDSERLLLNFFRDGLPSSWFVIGNAQIATGRRTREIDCIVVGDRRVWVIDAKGFEGKIVGNENEWILENGASYERVLDNVLHASSMLKGKIVKAIRELKGLWVEGLVVLTGDAHLDVEDARISRHVLPMREALSRIISTQDGPLLLNDDTRLKVTQLIAGGKALVRSGSDRSFALAVQLEGTNGFKRTYYESLTLTRNELRGSTGGRLPPCVKLLFENGNIFVENIGTSTNLKVGGEDLTPGGRAKLGIGETGLAIGDVRLRATVFYWK